MFFVRRYYERKIKLLENQIAALKEKIVAQDELNNTLRAIIDAQKATIRSQNSNNQ